MAQTVREGDDIVDPAVLVVQEIMSGLREHILQHQDALNDQGANVDLGSLTINFVAALIVPEPQEASEATKDIIWLLTDEPNLREQLLREDNFPRTILLARASFAPHVPLWSPEEMEAFLDGFRAQPQENLTV